MKILIIEDDKQWSEALKEAYEKVFADEKQVEITIRNIGYDAIRDINDCKEYDLLSLDLNLASTAITDESGKIIKNISGYDGRSILNLAHHKASCKGVVIVSGIHEDEEFIWIDEKEGELKKFKRTIHQILEELFPGKNAIFYKGNIKETAQDILTHKNILYTVSGLNDVPEYGYYLVGEKWEMIFNGTKLYFDDNDGFRYLYILIQKRRKLDGPYLYQFSKRNKSDFTYYGSTAIDSINSSDISPKMGDSIDYNDGLSISNSSHKQRILGESPIALIKQYDGYYYQLDKYINSLTADDIEKVRSDIVRIGRKLMQIMGKDHERYEKIKKDTNLLIDSLKGTLEKYERDLEDAPETEQKAILEKIKAIKIIQKNPEMKKDKNLVDSVRSGINSAINNIEDQAQKLSISGLIGHFARAFQDTKFEYRPIEEIPWRLYPPKNEFD